MRLSQLTRLETDRLKDEENKLKETIAFLKKLLGSEQEILAVIRKEVMEIKKRYGDDRRTKIIKSIKDIGEEDLVLKKDVIITVTD